jgi:hypothetical protein
VAAEDQRGDREAEEHRVGAAEGGEPERDAGGGDERGERGEAEAAAVASQVRQAARPAGQASAIVRPRKVATPLPPLKPSQTGKQWPRKAAKPATIAAVSPARARAASTAAAPLAASSSSVAAAAALLPVRSTLVAPMLPEPMLLRSPRPRARAISTPKGIEPSR